MAPGDSSSYADRVASSLVGFVRPDITSPLDVDRMKKLTPTSATCKGLVADSAVQAVRVAGIPAVTTTRFVAFRDYPTTEVIDVFVASARALEPTLPLRDALRRLGFG